MSTARAYVLDDVIEGMRGTPKRLPCRLLYDAIGVELFERVTQLPEYYPYRDELRVLDDSLPSIAAAVGAMARVIEPGSGVVAVHAQVEMMVSNDRGVLLFMVKGDARAEISRSAFRPRNLPQLQEDALTAAAHSALNKLGVKLQAVPRMANRSGRVAQL